MNEEQINKWINDIRSINIRRDWPDSAHLLRIAGGIAEMAEANRRNEAVKSFAMSGRIEDDAFSFVSKEYFEDEFVKECAAIVFFCCDYLGSRNLKYELGYTPSFPNGFYDTFAEKGWEWVMILADTSHKVEDRVCHLIYEVLWFCENHGIDIGQCIEEILFRRANWL